MSLAKYYNDVFEFLKVMYKILYCLSSGLMMIIGKTIIFFVEQVQ